LAGDLACIISLLAVFQFFIVTAGGPFSRPLNFIAVIVGTFGLNLAMAASCGIHQRYWLPPLWVKPPADEGWNSILYNHNWVTTNRKIDKTYAWYLDITPNQMFSLYDYPVPGKAGFPLCEEGGGSFELKEAVLFD